MRIHSNTLTANDLYAAANAAGVTLFQCDRAGSRKRDHAFEVALSGTSPYAAQRDTSYKAATWDEWGNFLARLFHLDCLMIAGPYKGNADFLRQTREAVEHAHNYERITGSKRPGMSGPWLAPMAGESEESFKQATQAA